MSRAETTQGTSGLIREAVASVEAVRTACMDLLSALPPVERPADLTRVLGIDYKMCRRVVMIAEADTPMDVVLEIPRPGAMPRLLKASAKLGVDGGVLERLEQAVENFESLAKRHAGDRPTFDAMVAPFSPEAGERSHLEAKRAAYRANTQLFGCQVDTRIAFAAIRPSDEHDGCLDSVWVTAQLGLKRFHPSSLLDIAVTRFLQGQGDAATPIPNAPPEGGDPAYSDPFLMREFCSDPLPALEEVPALTKGFRRFAFKGDEIGLNSAIDCVTAQVVRARYPKPDEHGNRHVGMQVALDVPTSTQLMDLFVHEAILDAEATPLCFSTTNTVPREVHIPNDPDPSILSLMPESAQVLGLGPGAARTKSYPQYDRLVRAVFDRMGWPGADAHRLVRCRMEYPVLNTHTVLRVRLKP